MTEDNHLWYVSEWGAKKGPYTAEMVQSRIDRGDFGKSALVWTGGQTAWQPISLHFHFHEVAATPAVPTLAAHLPADQPPLSLLVPYAVLRWTCLIIAAACAAVCCIGIPFQNLLTPNTYLLIRIVTLATLMSAGALAIGLWWKTSSQFTGQRGGLQKSVTVVSAVVISIVAFVFAIGTPLAYRVQVARSSFGHFELQTDVLTRTIRIKGLIGPGMARQLAVQIASNADIHNIEIDSFGGLVDEALAAAHDIQNHGGLAVTAKGACNSACLLIFMSGEKRIAPADLSFGFHATSAITPIEGAYNEAAMSELGDDADKYLVSRGVPKDFVNGARALGPQKLYSVSAIRMAEAGAVTELTDSGIPISQERARWIAVTGILRHSLPSEELDLFETINKATPTIAQAFASTFLDKIDENDAPGAVEVTRNLINEIAAKALPSAGDDALSDAVAVISAELQYIRNNGRWDVCASFLNGKGFGTLPVPPRLAALDFRADNELVASAAETGWAIQPIALWANEVGPAVVKDVAAKMAANGETLQALSTDQRVACDWTANLLAAFATKQPRETANLYRWLLSQK